MQTAPHCSLLHACCYRPCFLKHFSDSFSSPRFRCAAAGSYTWDNKLHHKSAGRGPELAVFTPNGVYLSSRVRYSWSCAARVPLSPLHKGASGRMLLSWSSRGPLVVADQVSPPDRPAASGGRTKKTKTWYFITQQQSVLWSSYIRLTYINYYVKSQEWLPH